MTTTPDPIAAIERELDRVTHAPGPWVAEDAAVYCDDATGQRVADCKGEYLFWPKEKIQANAAYIAACNPVAITALLALARQSAEKDAEIARLREGLKPFAEEAGCYDPDTGDSDDSVWATPVYFKIRDLRRARTLLENSDAPHD